MAFSVTGMQREILMSMKRNHDEVNSASEGTPGPIGTAANNMPAEARATALFRVAISPQVGGG
jgi:hypothetical protein